MTTANKVTILRILLVPFFVYEFLAYRAEPQELHRLLALGAFAAAAILDGVDGFIARRFHQKSELGAILDPLADKLLLTSAVVLLSLPRIPLENIPLWLTALILSRDVMLILGLVLIHFLSGRVVVRPRIMGKIATVLQMALVLWAMLRFPPDWQRWLAYAAGASTAISGLLYLGDGLRQLSASPQSAATPGQRTAKADRTHGSIL
jgi:cardiolipin synthase (CMP-forming)